ncbi:MAG: LPXTG cell wall anchor domain-containing protein [Erysipelotrichaceae bacterium]|nr:LPXTG cell wall anchor domain-containing protein [Erysipelotrichaceae bacterium]MBR2792649.1 LPXTG cell wall anchor domain-containing protein [Erysipelotrichaceae bacterium]MBR3351490.1 LPXTG cell wall anchor domain-containing protein [Erysipelotrichaceae bacterium]
MKYYWEFKLECVEKYLRGEWAEKKSTVNIIPIAAGLAVAATAVAVYVLRKKKKN